ncbi:MAG: CxxC-x17-CxxC domain-containing protein [Candidatus Gracilibacteria bacterium]
MGNFTGGNRSSGGWRGDRGGDRGGRGGRDEGRPQMHQATCVECGQECEVPFKPNGLKPIFCRECFNKNNDKPSYDRPSYDRPSYDAPKPRFDKPLFDKPKATEQSSDQNKEQFAMLNVKLDYILKALSTLGATKIQNHDVPQVQVAKEIKKEIKEVKEIKEPKVAKEAKPAKKAKKAKA